MRKDIKDIDQSLRNEVLEVQEECAELFGLDPYAAGIFLWECIYEQLEDVFENPALTEQILRDLILNVMGDDRIFDDAIRGLRENRADQIKSELEVDEELVGFGRMTNRIIISGHIGRLEMIRDMLFRYWKVLGRIQKILNKMLRGSYLHALFADFPPEYRYDEEHRDEIIDRIIKEIGKRMSAYRKRIRKAAEIAKTALDIEIERGRIYGFEQ